jgi:biotin operon repressor
MSATTAPKAFDRIHWAQAAQTDSTSKHILSMLAIHADRDTGYCYVKQSTLARETGYQRPTISVHVQRLRDEGWIDCREQTGKNGYRKNHEYLLLFRDGLRWPDGTIPRVSGTNTGKLSPRVSDDDMAASSKRTSPRRPNEHAVSGKQTRRVSEGDSINKPSNKPHPHVSVNKSTEQGGDFVSAGVRDEDTSMAKETPLERLRKRRAEAAERRASGPVQPADPSEDIVPDKMDAAARKAYAEECLAELTEREEAL